MWFAASIKASSGIEAAAQPFIVAQKLQRELTESIEKGIKDRLMAECRRVQRTIIGELSHAPQSGAWLLALPSQPAYRLRDEEYRMAVRKRLGMLPDAVLVDDRCLACHPRNLELPQLKVDPHHAEACLQQTGTTATQRHNMIVDELVTIGRSAGASVRTGQPVLGDAFVTTRDPTTGIVTREIQHSDKRGDLLITIGAKQLLVDVTVPRATAPTALKNAALRRPGDCAAVAEQDKTDMYDALCQQRRLEFVPFAIESHGGVGPAARRLLLQLASRSCELTAQAFLADAFTRLSVALQRGNALVLTRGMEQLRDSQFGLAGGDRPQNDQPMPASRRRHERLQADRRRQAAQGIDMRALFHARMRAGGSNIGRHIDFISGGMLHPVAAC